MDVELVVGNVDVMFGEGGEDSGVEGAVDGVFLGGVAEDLAFVGDGGIVEFAGADGLGVGDEVGFGGGLAGFGESFHGLIVGEFVGKGYVKIEVFGEDGGFFDAAVGDGEDLAGFDIFNFGRLEADDDNLTFDVLVFDGVADGEIIVGDDGSAADDVLEGILDGETEDGAGDTDTGEERRNLNVIDLKNNENGDGDEDVANDTVAETEVSGAAGTDVELEFAAIAALEEEVSEELVKSKAEDNNDNRGNNLVAEEVFEELREIVHRYYYNKKAPGGRRFLNWRVRLPLGTLRRRRTTPMGSLGGSDETRTRDLRRDRAAL